MPFHAHDAHWMQRETLIERVSCRLIWASSPITVISPHSALATHSFAQCFDDGDLIKGIVKGTVRRSSLCGFWFCCSNEVVTSHFLAKGRRKKTDIYGQADRKRVPPPYSQFFVKLGQSRPTAGKA